MTSGIESAVTKTVLANPVWCRVVAAPLAAPDEPAREKRRDRIASGMCVIQCKLMDRDGNIQRVSNNNNNNNKFKLLHTFRHWTRA